MVESFSEKNFLCADRSSVEGLDHINRECENFVRFTHAFAPSDLTQPNIASILTGQPITSHKVHHNGANAISGQFQTLAESALNQGMRTGFFSGGVPLLPKFGMTQGYELFSGSYDGSKKALFRPFNQTVKRALRWVDEEVRGRSFLMTFYIPDLLYKEQVTHTREGQERPVDRDSQLIEIYESIDELISGLIKRKRWENAHFIVVGLNGQKKRLAPTNPVSATRLRVPLQMKIAGQVSSNIDEVKGELVSFSRLGEWVEKLIFHKPSQGALMFPLNHDAQLIAQESHWLKWQGLSDWVFFGLRKKRYLFTLSPSLRVFDSFDDFNEARPLEEGPARTLVDKFDIRKHFKNYFKKPCLAGRLHVGRIENMVGCPKLKTHVESVDALRTLLQWSDIVWSSERPIDSMSALVSKAIEGAESSIIGWLAYHSLYRKKWDSLFELGKHSGNQALTLVAQTNLREPLLFEPKGCLSYFVSDRKDISGFYKKCQDTGLRKVVEGINLLNNKSKPSTSFWDQVYQIKARRLAQNINLKMNFVNDIDKPFDFSPGLAELYFFLPDNSSYQNLINLDEI